VGFEIFVRPALRVMQGFSATARPVTLARLSHDVKKKQDRRYYLRGRVERDPAGEGYVAELSGSQSSALLTAAHRGNCFVVLPEGDGLFPAGTQVDCVRLDMEEGTP
jgi:molybdopterin molybdotransferase